MNDTYTPHNLPLQTGIIGQLSFISVKIKKLLVKNERQ